MKHVATASVKKSKLREMLRKDYVKTAILIIIVIGSLLSFWFGTKVVFRTDIFPFMTVVSGSMEPTLPVGSLIVVQGYVDPSTIYAAPYPNGDIIVFWHWDSRLGLEPLVHRAVGNVTVNGKSYLVTLGDANHGVIDAHYNTTTHERLDGLPREYVIGKVVASAPYIGQVILFMQTPSGKIIIVVLFVAILIVEFVPFPKKKEEKQVPEQEQVKA